MPSAHPLRRRAPVLGLDDELDCRAQHWLEDELFKRRAVRR